MMADEDRRDLEEAAALLAEHALTRVRYLGAWLGEPEDPGAYVEWVELTMDDGAVLRVTTDPDFGTDGVAIYEGPAPEDFVRVVDARDRGGWARVLGTRVAETVVHWSDTDVAQVDVATTEGPRPTASLGVRRVRAPSDLEIRFADGEAVSLTASGWDGEGGLAPEQDNVAVVFGDADAKRLGIARWRRQSRSAS